MKSILRVWGAVFTTFFLAIILFGSPAGVMATDKDAVFAGGCFWCLEHDLEILPGVHSVESGYSGGDLKDPTYERHKGHKEAVIVHFDPDQISYAKLLRNYWRNVDPFDSQGQFCDRGDSYRPVIFVSGEEQAKEAFVSAKMAAYELDQPLENIKVQIEKFDKFWPAEDYHQDFASRNNLKYKFYRYSCGRDLRLDEVWGLNARGGDEWGEFATPNIIKK